MSRFNNNCFEVGDKIKLIGSTPENKWAWVSSMDKLIGRIFTIKDICGNFLHVDECSYGWNKDWFIKIYE